MNPPLPSVYYVYGFTRAGAKPPPNVGVGVDEGQAPYLWICGEVAVVLSLVAPEEFCGPEGERNLQNLEWLGPRACRHQAVIEQIMLAGPVMPARFGTLFSSLDELGKFLAANTPAIVQFLKYTAGRDEWAVKGYLRRALAEAQTAARLQATDGGPAGVSPGAAYLREQRLQITAKRALTEWLAETSATLVKKLDALAVESCQRRLLSQDALEADGEMVLNWAFLVPRTALADFQAQIEQVDQQHRPDGLTFVVSGPWPPYSFFPALEPAPQPNELEST